MQVTQPTHPPQLSLAPHVRACGIGDQIILLDLRRNRYLSVGGPGVPILSGHVQGWPDGHPPSVSTPAAVDAFTRRLKDQGLLTASPTPSQQPTAIEEATASLEADSSGPGTPLRAGLLIRFLRSAASSALSLRVRSLDVIADSVAVMHARIARTLPAAADTLRVAATYESLRPFGFTAQDKCLHDSLTLMHFLAAEGATARWVIGVKTRPFAAHSWVQLGATVLNDQHAHVRHFTPILVV